MVSPTTQPRKKFLTTADGVAASPVHPFSKPPKRYDNAQSPLCSNAGLRSTCTAASTTQSPIPASKTRIGSGVEGMDLQGLRHGLWDDVARNVLPDMDLLIVMGIAGFVVVSVPEGHLQGDLMLRRHSLLPTLPLRRT